MPADIDPELVNGLCSHFYAAELTVQQAGRIRARLMEQRAPQRRRLSPVALAAGALLIATPVAAATVAPQLAGWISAATDRGRDDPGLYDATISEVGWQPLSLQASAGGYTLRCHGYYSDGWQTSVLCGLSGRGSSGSGGVALILRDAAGHLLTWSRYERGTWPAPSTDTGIYTFYGSVVPGPAQIRIEGTHLPIRPTSAMPALNFDLQATTARAVREVHDAGTAVAGGVKVTITDFIAGPASTRVQWRADAIQPFLRIEDASGVPTLTAGDGGQIRLREAAGGSPVTADLNPMTGNSATVTLSAIQADLAVAVNARHAVSTAFEGGTVTITPRPAAAGVTFRLAWTGVVLSVQDFVLITSDNGWYIPKRYAPGGDSPALLNPVPDTHASDLRADSGALDLNFPQWPTGAVPVALRLRRGVTITGPWTVHVALPGVANTPDDPGAATAS